MILLDILRSITDESLAYRHMHYIDDRTDDFVDLLLEARFPVRFHGDTTWTVVQDKKANPCNWIQR